MTIEYYDGTTASASNTSGWVCRLRSRFTDSLGGTWVVEIIDQVTDSTGGFNWPTNTPEPFQLGPDGFTWKMDGKSDTFQVGAISTEVTFDLMVTETRHDTILSVIAGSEDMRLGVAIYTVNGPVSGGAGYTRPFWFGLIATEGVNWGPYTHPDSIRIKAHCGLSLLNDIEYTQNNGSPFTNTTNLGEHLRRIFQKIPTHTLWGWSTNGSFNQASSGTSGSSEGILTMYQWIADKDRHLFGANDTLEKSVFGFTQCDSDSFNEVDREEDIFGGTYVNTESISCAEVLKNILTVFQTRMFQYGGTFLANCPWQTGSSAYMARYQYAALNDTIFTATEDTVTETALHAAGFEQVAGVRDSFLFPIRQSKSTHKKGGARTIIRRSQYTANVSVADGNVYSTASSFASETINSANATVEGGTSISLVGNFRLWSLGYGPASQNYNVDIGVVGCKPVCKLTIKVGNLYLKRNLVMSSTGYNIHRTAAPDLTYKPLEQSGAVEWTTTPSTYDFQIPFPGCDEEPAVYNDDIVGGLHLALGNNDPFKFNSGFLSDGTQTQQVVADVAWNLPALPASASDYEGVTFKAELKYMFRDGNNTLAFGPESAGGTPGLSGYTPLSITGLRIFASNHDDPDADVVFSAANTTNYTSEQGCKSILGDRYTDQNLGVLFLDDVNNAGNVQASEGNWVTWGDTSDTGRPIHQLIARENLFMREETLRTRKASFVGRVSDTHREFNRVAGTFDSSKISLLPPTRLVSIVDEGNGFTRKWYIMNMAFTAASQVYDCELVMLATSGGGVLPDENDTRPFGPGGEPTGGDSTNPSGGGVLPVGLKGDTGTVVTTSGDVSLIQSKTDLLTITGATNLDTMRTDVNNNSLKVGISTDQANKLGAISYSNNAISGFNFGSNTNVIHAENVETDQDFQFVSQQLKLTIGTDSTARLVTDLINTTGGGSSRKITGIETTSGELDVNNAREVEQLITVQSLQGGPKRITGIEVAGGSVMSVDNLAEGVSRKFATPAEKRHLGHLTSDTDGITAIQTGSGTSLDTDDARQKMGFLTSDSNGITEFTTGGGGGTDVNLYHIHNALLPGNSTCANTGSYADTCSAVKSAGRLPDPDQNRSGQTGEKLLVIDSSGNYNELAQGTAGQVLQDRGSGSFQFQSLTYPVASVSARVTASYSNNFYYGNSSYGWNYPIWSSISFNNQTGNPYARRINDDYAHCGIVSAMGFSSFKVYGTIRNDSSTDNVKVGLFKHARPNGSTSNMTVTEVASQDITVSTQDAHNNVEFTSTVGCDAGDLLFIGIARTAGSTGTRYLNFSISIQGTV